MDTAYNQFVEDEVCATMSNLISQITAGSDDNNGPDVGLDTSVKGVGDTAHVGLDISAKGMADYEEDDESIEAPPYSPIHGTEDEAFNNFSPVTTTDDDGEDEYVLPTMPLRKGYALRDGVSADYRERASPPPDHDEHDSSEGELQVDVQLPSTSQQDRPMCKFANHMDWEVTVKGKTPIKDGNFQLVVQCPPYLANPDRCSNIKNIAKLPVVDPDNLPNVLDLSDHEDELMRDVEEIPIQYQCQYCMIRYDSLKTLREHVRGRLHRKDKRYIAIDCPVRKGVEKIPARAPKNLGAPKLPWAKPVWRDGKRNGDPMNHPGVAEEMQLHHN